MLDAAVGGGRGNDDVRCYAGDAVADGFGFPAVEAEDELVESRWVFRDASIHYQERAGTAKLNVASPWERVRRLLALAVNSPPDRGVVRCG